MTKRFSETFNVGERYRATFTMVNDGQGKPVGLKVEWDPGVPTAMTEREADDYRTARGKVVRQITEQSGPVALIEI